MNPELINIYIECLLKEVTEGVKSRILLETQLKYTEMTNKQLQSKVNDLEKQIEKLNNRKSKKEVNTSDDNF